jgi:hypothetical protein
MYKIIDKTKKYITLKVKTDYFNSKLFWDLMPEEKPYPSEVRAIKRWMKNNKKGKSISLEDYRKKYNI